MQPVQRQTLISVTRAEFAKLIAVGGPRRWIVFAAVLGAVSAVGAVVLSQMQFREMSPIPFADLVTAGPTVSALALSLAATTYVPREISGGTVVTSKYLVPRVTVLFLARLFSWALLTGAVGVITMVIGLVAALVPADLRNSAQLADALLLAVALVLCCVLVLLAHSAATLLQRGAVCVAVGMLLLFVLPLAFMVLGIVLPGIAELCNVVVRLTLGALLYGALQLPNELRGDWATWGQSMLGALVWLAGTTALAFLAFRKPGYGDV